MKVDILTLFPEMFSGPLDESIVGRARKTGILDLTIHHLRNWAHDRHKTVDDRPFGGGPGMVLKPEPIFEAVESLGHVILICGSYEGFDERIREHLADDALSIGDYVLTNGALPAMVIVDAVTRLLPGALGDAMSATEESHGDGLLEYPHYTRPAEFRGWSVPEVLMSGNHADIARWRQRESMKRTAERRPDLWEKYRWRKPAK